MSKNKSRGGDDRKGESVSSESVAPRMTTSQAAQSGLHTLRPNPALTTGHTYILQPHHEMKNLSKSARPIAPAPPAQSAQNLSARSVQSSQANIPSIISPTIGPGNNDSLVSLSLVTTTASGGLGPISHNPITVPVTLSQASVLQLGSSTTAGSLSVVQQGIPSSAIPITMLRSSNTTGQPQQQPHIQAFAQNFSHLPRGSTSPAVSKTTGLLRQGTPPALQIQAGLNTLPLPIVRAPLLQPIKTTTAQATRPQSPAVGAQQAPQAQPQDLSRTNFPMHGSITPAASGNIGPLPMHVTLNRIDNSPVNSDTSIIQSRSISTPGQKDAPANIQQRISVSLSSETSGLHTRLAPDLPRSTLPFTGPKVNHHLSLVQQSKVVNAQPGSSVKSVNLAVTTPVMINSINPSQMTATTTVASSAPIPIAKVTPQRQLPVGSIPSSPAPLPAHMSSSSSSLSASSAPLSISVPHTSITALTIASSSSLPVSLTTNVGETGAVRHEQSGVSSAQPSGAGILIASDFQTRPPGSIITMTTLPSSIQGNTSPLVVSQAENRSSSQNQQQFDVKPGDSMWLQHYVYQNQLVPQPTQIVRPGASAFALLPSQGRIIGPASSIAASQLAAISVASTSNVRFNTAPVMMVEQLRQHHQQHPLHTPFSAGTTTVSATGDKTANLLTRATVASSIYTASAASVQSQITGGGSGGGGSGIVSSGLSATPVLNPSSSPRPSILRKRTSEATGVVIRKPNFNLNQDTRCHSPPRVDTSSASICSPKISTKNFSPVSENSQSSTDTALSSNDATTPTHNHNEKGKGYGDECMENGPASSVSVVNNIPSSPAVSHADSLLEASPRKRARKQLLHVSEELKDDTTSSEDELQNSSHCHREDTVKELKHLNREIRGEYTDEEGVRWVLNKPKPSYVLLQPDFINNKTKNNHFTRYSDVRPKEERRPTVNELSNQRGIMQKVNGWKLYFSASQLEELMEVEKEMEEQFAAVQSALAQVPTSRINNEEAVKIHEMSQANIQRCQLIHTQLFDARAAMLRTLEHKTRIQEIVNKHVSKRPIKKKERM